MKYKVEDIISTQDYGDLKVVEVNKNTYTLEGEAGQCSEFDKNIVNDL